MTIQRVKDKLNAAVSNLVGKEIEKYMLLIEAKAVNLQNNFFRYLAVSAGVIGVSRAPTFNGISLPQPQWAPLTLDYVARKKGTGKSDDFFLYTGALQKYFLTSAGSAVGKFGKPVVTFSQGGQGGYTKEYTTLKTKSAIKSTGVLTPKGNASKASFKISNSAFGKISIDLFPRVVSFSGQFNTSRFFPKVVSYKLDNAQHEGNKPGGHSDRSRQFMGQYMQWWLRVKGREMLQGVK